MWPTEAVNIFAIRVIRWDGAVGKYSPFVNARVGLPLDNSAYPPFPVDRRSTFRVFTHNNAAGNFMPRRAEKQRGVCVVNVARRNAIVLHYSCYTCSSACKPARFVENAPRSMEFECNGRPAFTFRLRFHYTSPITISHCFRTEWRKSRETFNLFFFLEAATECRLSELVWGEGKKQDIFFKVLTD